MVRQSERELFERESISRAVMRLALPTVAGQIILVTYNVADTFLSAWPETPPNSRQ